MTIAPVFVTDYETAWFTTTTPKTVSVDVDADDVLVVCGMGGDWATSADNLLTPTGGGLTYSLATSVTLTGFCQAYLWTARSSTTQSFTLSGSMNGGGKQWGFVAQRFSGVDRIGVAAADHYTGVHSGTWLDLTTTDNDSVTCIISGDWNAADGTSRTWRTVNGVTPATPAANGETTYARDASFYGVYAGYYPTSGIMGSNTYGQSAPTGQKYTIVGVELIGLPSPFAGRTSPYAQSVSLPSNQF